MSLWILQTYCLIYKVWRLEILWISSNLIDWFSGDSQFSNLLWITKGCSVSAWILDKVFGLEIVVIAIKIWIITMLVTKVCTSHRDKVLIFKIWLHFQIVKWTSPINNESIKSFLLIIGKGEESSPWFIDFHSGRNYVIRGHQASHY